MKIEFPIINKELVHSKISLEVATVRGIPEMKILGISGNDRITLKEKLKTSFKTSGIKLKSVRKVINIGTEDLVNPEQLELQLAAMLLHKLHIISINNYLNVIFLGRIDLNGTVHKSLEDKEILHILEQSADFVVVCSIETEIEHVNLIKISKVKELVHLDYAALKALPCTKLVSGQKGKVDFEGINDLNLVKYLILITLISQGSILLMGASGVGKSLIFRSLPSLGFGEDRIYKFDPAYSLKEFKETVAKLEKKFTGQEVALIFNEINDYSKSFLDYMKIFFDKIEASEFNCRFLVFASMNPCKCGNYGHKEKICMCNPFEIKRYKNRLGYPLVERFDLVVNLNEQTNEDGEFPAISTKNAKDLLKASTGNGVQVELNPFVEQIEIMMINEFNPSERRKAKVRKLAEAVSRLRFETELSEESMFQAINFNSYILNFNS
jgi:magnesium chelatase family protein